MSNRPAWAVCKLWPSQDIRLLAGSVSAITLWLGHCAACDRKVVAGKRLYQLAKAGHVRLFCEQCAVSELYESNLHGSKESGSA